MKRLAALCISILLLSALTACGQAPGLLDPHDPVSLTMWHVYGEQADSPMNRLIDEFNATVGRERGVLVNVTLMTNSAEMGPRLLAAQQNIAGAGELPDLFFCHPSNAAALGADQLLNWNDWFSPEEQASFVDSFWQEGLVEGRLAVLPVSKSTHLLFVNGAQFQRFSADTGVTYGDLATWDGFFRTAEAYHAWSGGKPFCALDFLLRAVELNALSQGAPVSLEDGWYDFADPALQAAWAPFARALVQGHIAVSDLYSNTQVMTGEVAAGLGSSAAVLYYNDTVTYENNVSEPMLLAALPMPQAADGLPVATQAGVGLSASRTTEARAEAASLFAHWLTEGERNLDFVASTGYMPVRNASYEAIDDYPFAADGYAAVYRTLKEVRNTCTSYTEPAFPNYYQRVNALYAALRVQQQSWAARAARGEALETLMQEAWDLFRSI